MSKEEELRIFFERDRFVKANGIKIVYMNDAESCCEAEILDVHLNAGDVVQGGMIYTLADFTFACLANYKYALAVTQNASISYICPARTKKLRAVAREICSSNRNTVCEVSVYDDIGEIVATAMINGFIKNK